MSITTIQLNTGGQSPIAATISTEGLRLYQLFVQHDGKTHDVIIGPEKAEHFRLPAHKYHNVIIGRYANRLPVDTFELEKGQAAATLKTQLNEKPDQSLHGGPIGFDEARWSQIDLKDADSSLFSSEERKNLENLTAGSAALFKHTSEDGDQGFPGTLEVQVLFVVVPAAVGPNAPQFALGSLAIVYRAKVIPGTNCSKTVTALNLTQHWGFNLDASLLSSAPQPMTLVKDHILTIDATHTIELNEFGIATGKLVPVEKTPQHQHDHKRIGDRFPTEGYDNFYVFAPQVGFSSPIHVPAAQLESLDVVTTKGVLKPFKLADATKPLAELSSPETHLTARFTSNQPGCQFWTANSLDANAKGSRKLIHGGKGTAIEGDGDGYPPYSGAFLEFHELLAAWLHEDFRSHGTDTLLTSDAVYNNFARVDILASAVTTA